jgi:hypothetical protein
MLIKISRRLSQLCVSAHFGQRPAALQGVGWDFLTGRQRNQSPKRKRGNHRRCASLALRALIEPPKIFAEPAALQGASLPKAAGADKVNGFQEQPA